MEKLKPLVLAFGADTATLNINKPSAVTPPCFRKKRAEKHLQKELQEKGIFGILDHIQRLPSFPKRRSKAPDDDFSPIRSEVEDETMDVSDALSMNFNCELTYFDSDPLLGKKG